ncbi:MAG: hypothetical protein DRI90_18535 [Deltaproteobacteria bacterium]|nr:MAG: hypothetical protein DRI90_18535 [Deltaproteobacteria bacterium]
MQNHQRVRGFLLTIKPGTRPLSKPAAPPPSWAQRALVGAAAVAALSTWSAEPAQALGSISAGDHLPLEQRVLISLGPDRTTLWTQLRVDTKPGPLAVVVPALPGAALDWSTPAWFEALEVATAPRILPPSGVDGTCPGEPEDDVFQLVGSTYHVDPLPPLELTVVADADGVVAWADQHGLVVSPPLVTGLSSLTGHRFVIARFNAPDGVVLTPTLRVVSPAVAPVLPLVMTTATSEPLVITAWTITAGRAELDGQATTLPTDQLAFDAATGESNYESLRATELASPAGASLLECSSRAALVGTLMFGEASHQIEGVVTTYFKRAALYQSGAIDGAACTAQSEATLATATVLAASCPRADLGIVDGTNECTETILPGQADPELLRCGPLADDLAVALSGLTGSDAWLSRHGLWVDTGEGGWMKTIASTTGPAVDPVWTATTPDLSGCGEGGAGGAGSSSGTGASSSGSTGSSGTGGAATVQVPVYEVDTSCGAHEVGAILYYVVVEASEEEPAPEYYYEEEDCSGDTSESYTPVYDDGGGETDDYGYEEDGTDGYEGDDCGGDTSDTSTDSGDDCEGDTSDTGSGSDDDCEGDTSDSSGDSDCGGDTSDGSSDSGCSSGDGESGCALSGRGRRRKMPRLSILVVAAISVLTPLRRLTRRRSRRRKPSRPQPRR